MPDEAALLPADIVLIASDGAKVSRWIEATQRLGGFAEHHAIWTHAALYIGNDRVVEATPKGGVRVAPLSEVTLGGVALVRRLPSADPTIDWRYRIIVHAMQGLGQNYSLDAVPWLAWTAWRRRLWRPSPNVDPSTVTICSNVIRDAYLSAADANLVPNGAGVAWPADLSQSPRLVDVSAGWVKVAP